MTVSILADFHILHCTVLVVGHTRNLAGAMVVLVVGSLGNLAVCANHQYRIVERGKNGNVRI